MKKTILSIALALAAAGAGAAPRTADQALAIARRFVIETHHFQNVRSANLSLAPTSAAQMARSLQSSTPSYYVCNVENGGFVVVSGDDRFKEILGYSTNGTYDADNLPDGFAYWMQFLSNEMSAAIANGYEPEVTTTRATSANASQSVEPMLKTQWNQNQPYNNKLNGNMTGCVATGIAQVMNFWKYPTTGTGSHTGAYAPNFSADFGSTTYDWNNMLDKYGTGWETKAEVDAISTLMLHIGVASDMNWDKSASSTPAAYGAYALHNFFKYNKNLYIESRNQLSLGAWKALLIDQLQTGHPVCYSGMSSENGSVGHFFICDGYDAKTGQFHFNWGWAGQYDGYYEITSLEPGTGGIGAGAGNYDYSQTIYVNVQPEETGEYHANFDASTIKFSNSTNKEAVKVEATILTNNCTKAFTGTVGVAIYKTDGSLVSYIPSAVKFPDSQLHIGANYSPNFPYNYTVDLREVANGTYTVCAAVKDEEGNIHPMRARYNASTYYTMTVGSADVQFTAQVNTPDLTINSISLASNTEGNIFQNIPARFIVNVTNNSAQQYYDEIGVNINGGRGTNDYITVPAIIAAGETKDIEVYGATALGVKDGYTAKGCYGEDGSYKTGGNGLTINIKSEADGIENIIIPDGMQNAPCYNIAGQRVSSSVKGIIIQNGKKTIRY